MELDFLYFNIDGLDAYFFLWLYFANQIMLCSDVFIIECQYKWWQTEVIISKVNSSGTFYFDW